jgi:hypothetical protein
MKLNLKVLDEDFTVYKLKSISDLQIPSEANFFSLTVTDDEYSLMTDKQLGVNAISTSTDWKAIKVVGNLPFDIVGVTSNLTCSLAKENIGIMAVCTHDRDYILVQGLDLQNAIDVLKQSGHSFV